MTPVTTPLRLIDSWARHPLSAPTLRGRNPLDQDVLTARWQRDGVAIGVGGAPGRGGQRVGRRRCAGRERDARDRRGGVLDERGADAHRAGLSAVERGDEALDAVAAGDESYVWATPADSFPPGVYRIPVETYQSGSRLHYSFHEERIYIDR